MSSSTPFLRIGLGSTKKEADMRKLSFPMVIGAVVIGVVSGNVIFGPPLEKYWAKKLQEEAAKEGQTGTS